MSEKDLERLRKWEAKLSEGLSEPPLYWREQSETQVRAYFLACILKWSVYSDAKFENF